MPQLENVGECSSSAPSHRKIGKPGPPPLLSPTGPPPLPQLADDLLNPETLACHPILLKPPPPKTPAAEWILGAGQENRIQRPPKLEIGKISFVTSVASSLKFGYDESDGPLYPTPPMCIIGADGGYTKSSTRVKRRRNAKKGARNTVHKLAQAVYSIVT